MEDCRTGGVDMWRLGGGDPEGAGAKVNVNRFNQAKDKCGDSGQNSWWRAGMGCSRPVWCG